MLGDSVQHAWHDPPLLEGLAVVPHGAAFSCATSNVGPGDTRHRLPGTSLKAGCVGGNRWSATKGPGPIDRRLPCSSGPAARSLVGR